MGLQFLRPLKTFIVFDLPVDYEYLKLRFRHIHEKHKGLINSWPIAATRRKLINDFWFSVLYHYAAMVAICGILLIAVLTNLDLTYFLTVLVIGILLYLPLYVLLYRPTFTIDFLPKLETVIAEYEGNQRVWAEKCKQEQLSTRGLGFNYYIF